MLSGTIKILSALIVGELRRSLTSEKIKIQSDYYQKKKGGSKQMQNLAVIALTCFLLPLCIYTPLKPTQCVDSHEHFMPVFSIFYSHLQLRVLLHAFFGYTSNLFHKFSIIVSVKITSALSLEATQLKLAALHITAPILSVMEAANPTGVF